MGNEAGGLGISTASSQWIQGSITIPIAWIVIFVLIGVGVVVYRASKLLGVVMVVLGVIELLDTTIGSHIKAALHGLLSG